MHKTHARRQKNIKTKLMAAICMLLVSSIMMVSTTYAWFTLSTAPEVTGINTAVGANGNLEMALMPVDGIEKGAGEDFGITTGTGDSGLEINKRNVTWGNLVDVSNNTYYGLDQITLFPSQLRPDATKDAAGNPTQLPSGAFLETPLYGADGRIASMSRNAQTGIFTSIAGTTAFFPDDDVYGVRAVGTASGLSARELAFRNARAAANDARGMAATKAARSLSARGNNLAGIAVKLAAGGDAAYTKADLEATGLIITDLTEAGGVLDQIEIAYMQYLVAFAASSAIGPDEAWGTIKAAVDAEGATLASVMTKVNEIASGVALPAQLTDGINAYNTSVTNVNAALAEYNRLMGLSQETYTWTEISGVLTKLADPNKMLINDKTVDEIKANKQPLIDDVMGGKGITVSIATEGGVYADVADQCGNYTASIRIEGVNFQGIEIKTNATMNTKSTVTPAYLTGLGTAVEILGVPGTTSEALPMTDTFGYIIDLAFRTNAADSNLLLQPDAVDRIYEGSTGGEIKNEDGSIETTMGHGASMTFQSTNATFSEAQVKELMKSIRIVFFNPEDRTVYATAKLDVAAATTGTDGVTAKMYLYKLTAGGSSYETATTEQVTAAASGAEGAEKLYTASGEGESLTYTEVSGEIKTDGSVTYYVLNTTEAGEERITDNKIMSLTQNTATALSVLVYLDGNDVTNADVAATGNTSMKGTMNLQFSSSATLTPMEYSPLMGQTAETTETTTTGG